MPLRAKLHFAWIGVFPGGEAADIPACEAQLRSQVQLGNEGA